MKPSATFYCGVLLACGLWASPGFADNDTTESPATAEVQITTVEVRDVPDALQAYGSVGTAPGQQRSIAALRDSEVDAIQVVAGAAVRKGAVLMTLKAAPGAYAAYTQARSAADAAHVTLAQDQRLFSEHLIANGQLADAQHTAADADANLKAQEAMGGAAPVTEVRAPSDGVVGSIAVHAGDRIAANTTILTFSSTDPLYAQLGIPPEDAGRVKPGMPASVQAVFSPDARAEGEVAQVGSGLDVTTGLVEVLVRLSGKPALVPGSAVMGEITLTKAHGPAVPRRAVLTDEGGTYVFVVTGGMAHRMNVKTGPDDGKYIAVVSGLKAGDRVVTLGNYELDDGMAVQEQPR